VTKLMEYLHTDWSGMTLNDWLGVAYAVLGLLAMIVVYVLVLRPSNKEAFEAQSDLVLRDDVEHNNLGDR
jgi:cbb3-type cytochrome oxidase subunit 3